MDVDGEQRPFCGGLGALCGVAVPKHQQDSRSRQAIAALMFCGLSMSFRCAGVASLWFAPGEQFLPVALPLGHGGGGARGQGFWTGQWLSGQLLALRHLFLGATEAS